MDTLRCDARNCDFKDSIDKIQEDIIDLRVEVGKLNNSQMMMNQILDKQEQHLKTHIRRTAQNEFMIDELKKQTNIALNMIRVMDNERLKKIGEEEAAGRRKRRARWILGAIGTIVGIGAGIVSILNAYGII